MKQDNVKKIISEMNSGSTRALAKLISLVENDDMGKTILPLVHKNGQRPYTIGITGPPGVGKSTLTEKLVMKLKENGCMIGILAIDPTSPFSGGAILGDRVRLQKLSTDPQVFIRSMASRGHLGGISAATLDAAKLLEAFGCDYVIIETVGVGQSEVEIVQYVDTTLLILSPGQGDDIQVMKAGIMEIADIFVVNKADREGLERTITDIEMGQLNSKDENYTAPIVKTIAKHNEGMDDLVEKIKHHRSYLEQSDKLETKRKERLKFELWHRIHHNINDQITNAFKAIEIEKMIAEIYEKKTDSYSVAAKIIKQMKLTK